MHRKSFFVLEDHLGPYLPGVPCFLITLSVHRRLLKSALRCAERGGPKKSSSCAMRCAATFALRCAIRGHFPKISRCAALRGSARPRATATRRLCRSLVCILYGAAQPAFGVVLSKLFSVQTQPISPKHRQTSPFIRRCSKSVTEVNKRKMCACMHSSSLPSVCSHSSPRFSK